jgi:hypothetical protein
VYSPKIKGDLIPRIYKIAKKKGIPMTTLVDEVLRKALDGMDCKGEERSNKRQSKK